MSNPPGPPPEEQGNDSSGRPRLTFDEALCQKFRQLTNDCFNRHPELRSVVVVFDYNGGLNDAQVAKGLWLGENGAVKDIAAIFGKQLCPDRADRRLANTSLAADCYF